MHPYNLLWHYWVLPTQQKRKVYLNIPKLQNTYLNIQTDIVYIQVAVVSLLSDCVKFYYDGKMKLMAKV